MEKAARQLLAEAIDRTRRMMFELRPAVLHERGLAAAVAVLADEIRRETGASVDVNIPYRRYPATVEALAYRSLQEALANVRKDANATTVSRSRAGGPGGAWRTPHSVPPGCWSRIAWVLTLDNPKEEISHAATACRFAAGMG